MKAKPPASERSRACRDCGEDGHASCNRPPEAVIAGIRVERDRLLRERGEDRRYLSLYSAELVMRRGQVAVSLNALDEIVEVCQDESPAAQTKTERITREAREAVLKLGPRP